MFESSSGSAYRKRSGGDQWNSPGNAAGRHVKPRTAAVAAPGARPAAATRVVPASTAATKPAGRPAPPTATRDDEEYDSEGDEYPRHTTAVASTTVTYSSRAAPAFSGEEDAGEAGVDEDEEAVASDEETPPIKGTATSSTSSTTTKILRAPEPSAGGKGKGKGKSAAAGGRASRPADEHRELRETCALFARFKSKKTFCDLLKRYATAAGIKGGKKGSSEGQGGGINDTVGFVGTREGLCVGISELSAGQLRMYRELIKEMDEENYLCPDDYLEAPFYVNYQAASGALKRLPASGALVVAVVHDAGSVGASQDRKLAFYLECDDSQLSEMKVDLINPVGGDEVVFWDDRFSTDDIHCRIDLENPKHFLEQCSLYLGEEHRALSVTRRTDGGCVLTLSMRENGTSGRRPFHIPPDHVQWKTRFDSSELAFGPDLLQVLNKLQGMKVEGCAIVLTCNPNRPFEGVFPLVPTISTRAVCALGEGKAYSLVDYHCRPRYVPKDA